MFQTGRKWKMKSLKPTRSWEKFAGGEWRQKGEGWTGCWKRMLHTMLTTWAFCKLCRWQLIAQDFVRRLILPENSQVRMISLPHSTDVQMCVDEAFVVRVYSIAVSLSINIWLIKGKWGEFFQFVQGTSAACIGNGLLMLFVNGHLLGHPLIQSCIAPGLSMLLVL